MTMPDEANRTLTVGELINELSELPLDAPILFSAVDIRHPDERVAFRFIHQSVMQEWIEWSPKHGEYVVREEGEEGKTEFAYVIN